MVKHEIDICKIHTDRLRKLSLTKLIKAQTRAPLLASWSLASEFTDAIERTKRWQHNSEAAEKIGRVSDQIFYQRLADAEAKKADHLEHRIWDQQVNVGCRITDREQVARDADREGRHGAAATIRRQRALAGNRKRRR